MSEAQTDIIQGYAKMIAAGFGLSENGDSTSRDVMAYNPSILESLSASSKGM